jgi:hypothetical protein
VRLCPCDRLSERRGLKYAASGPGTVACSTSSIDKQQVKGFALA